MGPIFQYPLEPFCRALTDAMIAAANRALGVTLPTSFVAALRVCNGGYLRRSCFPTTAPTRMHPSYVEINEILGVIGDADAGSHAGGFEADPIDGDLGSRFLVEEWGYPPQSVVFSIGEEYAFLLDFARLDPSGEPAVVFVDQARGDGDSAQQLVLAPNFATFTDGLVWNGAYTLLGFARGVEPEAVADVLLSIGATVPGDDCSAEFRGQKNLLGDAAIVDVYVNEVRDEDNDWCVEAHPDLGLLAELHLTREHAATTTRALRDHLGDNAVRLLDEPPRWPSEAKDKSGFG